MADVFVTLHASQGYEAAIQCAGATAQVVLVTAAVRGSEVLVGSLSALTYMLLAHATRGRYGTARQHLSRASSQPAAAAVAVQPSPKALVL